MNEDEQITTSTLGEWYSINWCNNSSAANNAICLPSTYQVGDTISCNTANDASNSPNWPYTSCLIGGNPVDDRWFINNKPGNVMHGNVQCDSTRFADVTHFQSTGTGTYTTPNTCNTCCGGSGPGAQGLPNYPPYNTMQPPPIGSNYYIAIWHGYGLHHWNIPQGSCIQNCPGNIQLPTTYNCEQIGNHPKFGNHCVPVYGQPGTITAGNFTTLQACQDSGCEPIAQLEPKDLEPSPFTTDFQSKITQPEDEFGTVEPEIEPEIEPQAKITGGCGNLTPCPNGLDSECPSTPGSNPDGYSCVENCCIIATKTIEDPDDMPRIDKSLMERLQKLADIK